MNVLNTSPSATICGQCKAPIWSVIIDGLSTHLDPEPLTPATELAARFQHRAIAQTAPNQKMQWRWVEHIIHTPNAIRLAEHQHRRPPFPELVPLFDSRPTLDLPDEPEY